VQFIQLKNKKVYPTWVARYGNNYKIYIQQLIVMQVYHFTVKKDAHIIYSSIDNMIIFTEFNEAVEYIEQWIKKICNGKIGGLSYEEI
jgi:hypothetical protein